MMHWASRGWSRDRPRTRGFPSHDVVAAAGIVLHFAGLLICSRHKTRSAGASSTSSSAFTSHSAASKCGRPQPTIARGGRDVRGSALFEIAQAAMKQFARTARRPGRVVASLYERDLEAARRCIECGAATDDAPTNDDDVEALLAQPRQRSTAVFGAQMHGQPSPRSATSR
jgi:hypothetical protein